MTDLPPAPPRPSARRPGAAAWLALAGLLAAGALALAGHVEGAAGLVAGLALVGLAALASRDAPAYAVLSAPTLEVETPFHDGFERLTDPALLVVGGEPDDMASRRVVFANAAARALLRIPTEGALLVSALRRPEVLEAVDEALYGRTDAEVDYEATGAQERAWRLFATPLPSAEDAPAALVHLRDETDVRRAERMRADFLANASHELRTPLASLSGFIETLRGHARDDPAARERFLAIMSAQADRMGRLVADLLQLSRVELNEHVPPVGRFDLALACADVADALQPQSATLGVRLDLRLPPRGAALVAGDRDQIVQVVQNLIDNAMKYSAPGGAVRVEAVGASGVLPDAAARPRHALLTPDRSEGVRYAALRVSDDGPGMERDELPRLTERFYRVGGQKGPGTGLGLAIVRHIVNRHKGGLAVESAPGAGSSFVVTLPGAPASASPPPADPAAPPVVAAPPRHETVTGLS